MFTVDASLDAVNNPPEFSADTDVRTVPENSPPGTSVGDPVTATDDDGDTLTYTLEGDDALSFGIDSSTGQIQTIAGVTYDSEGTFGFLVTVKADDGKEGTDTIIISIGLTDVDEPPSVMPPPTVTPVTGSSDSLDVSWTAPDNSGKPDIESYDLQYRIGTSAWTDGPQDETGLSATITGLAAGTEYQVRVRATNDEGDSLFWSASGTGTTNAAINRPPAFDTEGLNATLEENWPPDRFVVSFVMVNDPDNDTLTFSIEGDDADAFNINPSNGQLTTKSGVTYDYEAQSVYTVTLRVDDGNGGTDTLAVTINIRDVDEPPSAPNAPTVTPVTGSSDSLDVSWTAPDNSGKPDIESYDLQYRQGTSGSWTVISVDGTGAILTGLDASTEYQVQVRATNDEGDSLWSASGTGTTNAQAVTLADTVVPADWSLIPNGLGAGDRFRLLFLSSSGRNSDSSNIADYNTFIQNLAAAGHTDIQQYGSTFRVVGSTADVDARDNTATTYTADDKGLAIYWLSGNKVADQYEDFYDGSWATEATAWNESGAPLLIGSFSNPTKSVWTGSEHDGTEAFDGTASRALGASLVRVGVLNSTDGPLSSDLDFDNASMAELFGLSGVFVVAGAALNVTELWSATLTVADLGSGTYGCSNEVSGKECSSLLDDDDFTYNGTMYQIKLLLTLTGTSQLLIHFTEDLGEDADSFVLNAGDDVFAFQDGSKDFDFARGWPRPGSWSDGESVSLIIAKTGSPNAAPVFPGDSATRELPENSAAGVNVGAAVTAMDDDGDTLAYTLEGTDAASFDIDASTGQIQTKSGVTYDHEAKPSYSVTVKADDSNGGTDTIAVTINVADVDEPPSVTAAPTVTPVTGSSDSLDVNWTAPDNTGKPDIESYDLQYRQGNSGMWTDGPQDLTRLTATLIGLDAGTEYQVQVRATNDEGDSDWSSAGTGTTNAQAQEPVLLAINLSSDPGTYTIDSTLSVLVTFSAAVTVSGTPQLALDIGGETRQAEYASGTGTQSLLFSYTVAEGDEDTDGIRIPSDSLALNGGAITAGGLAATLTHGNITLSGMLVDGVRPTLVSAETSVDGNTVSVTFSESLLSADANRFSVSQAGDPMVSSATIDATVDRVVTLTLSRALSHDDTLALEIAPNAVQDAAGNYNDRLSDSITNNVPPTNAAPVFTSADNFTADENQTAVGTVMATDADSGDTVTYAITGGDDQTRFQIDPSSGVLTFATAPDHENPTDADNDNVYQVTVTATGGTGGRALTTEQDITVTVNDVDETPAITLVSMVSDPGDDDTYGLGDTIEVQVVFDQAVIVTGAPRIEFEAGGNQPEHLKLATYADGSGTTTLRFDYVVEAADMDDNGIWLKADKLELNGGTILGVDDDVAANLDYSSLGRQDDHKVDGSLTTAAGCGTLPTGRLWSACLTVGTFTAVGLTFLGWHDDGSFTGSSLTDEDFDYGGDTYNLKEIALLAGALSVIFTDASAGDIAAQATRDKLTLHVGDTETFNLGDGTLTSQQTGVAWSSTGLTWAAGDTVALSISVPVETTPVPTTWSLVPSGLGDGDSFRLLFISTSNRDASSSDIADYNTFIQNLVDTNGHDDIKAHSATFRMLGSTEAVDARDNTGTTGTGVPIYWLGGAKVADDYADFYDGGWDEEATGASENGVSVSIGTGTKIWTGSAEDGTEATNAAGTSSRALGNAGGHWVMQGSPNGSDSAHGPIESNTANRTTGRGIYGLSGVFTVDASLDADTTPPALESATVLPDGATIELVFDEPFDLVAAALLTTTQFSVTADGSTVTIGQQTFLIDPDQTSVYRTVQLSLSPAITYGQVVTASYTDPTTGDDSTAVLEDAAGNDAASFTTGSGGVPAVVNNVPNTAPAFLLESTTREVAENSPAGTNVGDPVTATDADDDTLTYTLEGTDAASFDIDSASGQIQTKSGVTYDYETTPDYSVLVRADEATAGPPPSP